MSIDKYLDKYATKTLGNGDKYRWWWNGCHILAEAVASACYHVREDGCHVLTDGERQQLSTLEDYMVAFATDQILGVSGHEEMWLHSEAMWLLGQWFSRLWD